MALPNVEIITLNGGLGQSIQTNDGIVALLLQGVATGSLAVLTPKLITSLPDAEDLGIDAAYDTANGVNVYSELKSFYAEAGEGANLYIMLVPQAVNMQTMLDKDEANYAVKLLDFAQGKVKILGIVRNPAVGYVPDIAANNIDVDVINALTTGHALGEHYNSKFSPLRILIPAYAYGGDAGALVDLTAYDKNRVGVLLGGTASGINSVALLLGRLAVIPVQRNAGRVKDGSLTITEVFIGAETYEAAQGDVEAIHDKGFMTFRMYPRKAGFYFASDPMAAESDDDYKKLARGRVIDKATILAYDVFIDEINDEIAIDANGQIASIKAKYYESIIENQINNSMRANGEISSVDAYVDPAQNVLSTGKVCVKLEIVPVAYAEKIQIQLGFNNPANA